MEEAHQGGSPTPTGSRTPPFLAGEGKRRRGRRKSGLPPLSNSDQREGAPPSFWPLSSIPVWPNKAHILPDEFP